MYLMNLSGTSRAGSAIFRYRFSLFFLLIFILNGCGDGQLSLPDLTAADNNASRSLDGGDDSTSGANASDTAGEHSGDSSSGDGSSSVPDSDSGDSSSGTGSGGGASPRVFSRSEAEQASQFLAQATFGPRRDEIEALAANGNDYAVWIDQEMALPRTLHANLATSSGLNRTETWWSAVVDHDDQLRQRMAWALSQILVVSDRPTILGNNQPAMLRFYDLFVQHAFGNYRTLLEDVTLSLPMGIYLSMKDSRKADPTTGAHPDENYAREIMQLFTIGLWQLDASGQPVLENGKPKPTYTQHDVEELARIFSGWGSADAFGFGSDFSRPMKAYPEHHDSGAKQFLGHTFAAGQTPEQDLAQALYILFNHPNTGPFIARRLIQRLVTSNPSPQYIQRVAAVFADNGQGVRGDLGAVVKAILLDEEARGGATMVSASGKLREPLLRVTHLLRNTAGKVKTGNYWRPEKDFLQAPLRSPSVFNFYTPDFSPVGDVRSAGLVAPEFQITTTTSITTTTNQLFSMIFARWDAKATLDLSMLEQRAGNNTELVDHLDLVFMAGTMPDAMRQRLLEYLAQSSGTSAQKARDALYLVISSPQYAVQQ